jgi:hypothetical protein
MDSQKVENKEVRERVTYEPPAIAILVIVLYDLDTFTCKERDFILMFRNKIVFSVDVFDHEWLRRGRASTLLAVVNVMM